MAIIKIRNAAIDLDAAEIPNLDTSKITSGTFAADRIDNTSLSNVTALPFSAGTDWQSTIVTGSTLTAVAGKGYWIDTTSNACTITLPASASVGDFIEFSDYARTWGTNAITINTNSLNFQGATSPNPQYNTSGQSVKIIYSGTTKGWLPTVDDNVTLETPQTYSVEYLVVAGGGAGGSGSYSGGGGAGGYLTSSQSFYPDSVYTITVGAGGSVNYNAQGSDGGNSSLSGYGISTVTSIGGGGGGSYYNSSPAVGNDGGSGGGGSASGGSYAGGSGTAGQGNDGGHGYGSGDYYAGGGGGAGAVGQDGGSNVAYGGDGLSSSITGSATYYAGGGGGGSYQGATLATGGQGGGGRGGSSTGSDAGTDGTANTGGGGGGSGEAGYGTGAGGSGVVILRMLASNYSGTTTGSPTEIDDGSYKVLKFTGSGSYTG